MLDGVERESAEVVGRRVAAFPSHIAVCRFVKCKREKDNGKREQQGDDNVPNIAAAQNGK